MLLDLNRLFLSTLAFSLACSALGAGLGELKKDTEKKAAESKPKPKPEKGYATDSNSAFGSGTFPSASSSSGSGFMGDVWGWMIAGPFKYRSDDPNASMNSGEEGWAPDGTLYRPLHKPGDAVEPYFRADLNYQYIDSDNQAFDGRLEVGYKALAFHARTTAYKEDVQGLDQTINQYYGALRYGFRWANVFPGSAEIALGLGAAQQNGDLSNDSSVALTLPVKYYPTDWLGFEIRSAWYEADYSGYVFNIGDYDFSTSVGYRYAHFRLGYRLLYFGGSENGHYNNGPYAGLSLTY